MFRPVGRAVRGSRPSKPVTLRVTIHLRDLDTSLTAERLTCGEAWIAADPAVDDSRAGGRRSVDALAPDASTPSPRLGTPDIDLNQASTVPVEQVNHAHGTLVTGTDVVPSRLRPQRCDATSLLVSQHRVLQGSPGGSTCDGVVVAHAVALSGVTAQALRIPQASRATPIRTDNVMPMGRSLPPGRFRTTAVRFDPCSTSRHLRASPGSLGRPTVRDPGWPECLIDSAW